MEVDPVGYRSRIDQWDPKARMERWKMEGPKDKEEEEKISDKRFC